MPISTFMQTSLVRDANIAMAAAFFPRWRGGFWPAICGSTRSTRDPEPCSLLGAAPMMSRFFGTVNENPISSYSMFAPNFLMKNFERISRREIEFDQTNTVLNRVAQFGVRLAQYPDWLAALALIKGNSQTLVADDNGVQYPATFEPGIPYFSTGHTTSAGVGANTSNIVQGYLPQTVAELGALDIATQANRMQRDLQQLLIQIGNTTDQAGASMYPDFDPAKHLIVVCPPALIQPARLAFSTLGATIGGSNGSGGSSGATTNITPQFVRDVVSSPLLASCLDITIPNPVIVTPTYPTQYYFLIWNDYTPPLFYQRFRPKDLNELFPLGTNPMAQLNIAISAAKAAGYPVTTEAQDVYAAAEIGTNLSALGANGQESVYKNEEFFISGRSRSCVIYSLWTNGWLISPSPTS